MAGRGEHTDGLVALPNKSCSSWGIEALRLAGSASSSATVSVTMPSAFEKTFEPIGTMGWMAAARRAEQRSRSWR
ncbi:MAG: hypothetical protein U0361_04655 [Nitrospiraceae bacterium]